MADPAVKTALALCILLAGVCVATLCRIGSPRPVPAEPKIDESILLRYRAEARALRQKKSAQEVATVQETPSKPSATIVTPFNGKELPPPLAPEYPASKREQSVRVPDTIQMMLPGGLAQPELPRTHIVVDGDTLAALAERYLGSSQRADELFEANRDVLHDPQMLPIGVELKIPVSPKP